MTIIYKNLYPSRYTKYQKYLFNRIKKIEQKKQRVNVFDFSVTYEHMKP